MQLDNSSVTTSAASATSSRASILIVDSGLASRSYFSDLITSGGFRVVTAARGKEALRLIRLESYHLTVLQEIEDYTPSQMCREIKAYTQQEMQPELPVILLASSFDPSYAVQCLRAGLDDYISGPHLEANVLLARIEAVLRSYSRRSVQHRRERKATIRHNQLLIDPERFRVEIDGKPLDLTQIQFTLLYALASQPGRVLTRSQLRGVIAELGGNPDDGSIKSHIYHLRWRLGAAGDQIKTVRGAGHRLLDTN